MIKDFFRWFRKKSHLHQNKIRPFFHEREVWFAAVGTNIGFEQDGKGQEFLRPIIVIKKFNQELLWGMPTTTKSKRGVYYFRFEYKKNFFTTAIISQLRLIDSKRLKYRIGYMEKADFLEIKKHIISFLE